MGMGAQLILTATVVVVSISYWLSQDGQEGLIHRLTRMPLNQQVLLAYIVWGCIGMIVMGVALWSTGR